MRKILQIGKSIISIDWKGQNVFLLWSLLISLQLMSSDGEAGEPGPLVAALCEAEQVRSALSAVLTSLQAGQAVVMAGPPEHSPVQLSSLLRHLSSRGLAASIITTTNSSTAATTLLASTSRPNLFFVLGRSRTQLVTQAPTLILGLKIIVLSSVIFAARALVR